VKLALDFLSSLLKAGRDNSAMTESESRVVDPAEVPLTIEQPSFFFSDLPIEIRCEIYTYAFTPSPADKVPSQIAAPLLTCRQWYIEARSIAFATINWRIDLGRAGRRIYDEDVRLRHGESEYGDLYWLDIDEDDIRPERRILRYMFAQANLSSQHIKSLRRMTVSNSWYDSFYNTQVPGPRYELIWRLLYGALPHHQLDSVTLEYPDNTSHKMLEGLLSGQWHPALDLIWDTKIMKSIILKDSYEKCVTHDLGSTGSVEKIELGPITREAKHLETRVWEESNAMLWYYDEES
jgi:hypothetical protein